MAEDMVGGGGGMRICRYVPFLICALRYVSVAETDGGKPAAIYPFSGEKPR